MERTYLRNPKADNGSSPYKCLLARCPHAYAFINGQRRSDFFARLKPYVSRRSIISETSEHNHYIGLHCPVHAIHLLNPDPVHSSQPTGVSKACWAVFAECKFQRSMLHLRYHRKSL